MPKFVIEREVPGAGNLSDAQLREISQKSVGVLKGMGPEITLRGECGGPNLDRNTAIQARIPRPVHLPSRRCPRAR